METLKLYNDIPLYNEEYSQEPFITLYPAKGENNACVVVCPGGGYEWLAPHEGEPIAKWLNGIGVSAVVLNYRVKPYAYPVQLLDVQRAIKLVKFNADKLNADPDKVLTLGFSAGGHLAGMGGTFTCCGFDGDEIDKLSSKVAGMILCYPVISFVTDAHIGSADNLTGKKAELYDKLSLEKAAHEGMPPLFIWHTFEDATVNVSNSIALAQSYNKLGLDCELHIFPKGNHGMGLASGCPSVSQWTVLCERWLKQKGFIS
ncbi:MAG: alpha/beta hydrolase [Clostridia bacterium]|nr:alpha/beta hydrolase [Clostridia bacterium]